MKYCKDLCLLAAWVSFVFVVCSCRPKPERDVVGDEEPLLLLNEPLFLLDDMVEAGDHVADNSRCHVCHLNFAAEKLAVIHALADISCEDCHGESDAHCGDEDNITPPEIMYPAEKINPSCLRCHGETITKSKQHKEVLADTLKKNCTDCHGKHRMSHRTRKWDKETGELLSDDKVRMMTDDMLKDE